MKYFFDTEFIEGFHKPLFGKRRHFIDLISIGIVAEDGREYYAISNEYNYADADDWVKENVILPLYKETVHGDARNVFTIENFNKHFGLSNKQIAERVFQFCTNDFLSIDKAKLYNAVKEDIEFYAYYADYDWVVFCSLFGRMIDLPKGFPMYCKDLKQILDEKVGGFPRDFEANLKLLKSRLSYPKQENEHNALDDARWNFKLFNFLKSI